jgi:hypothetical protein
MTLEQMISLGPIHVCRRDTGKFHATWAPFKPDGTSAGNAIGVGETPYSALGAAQSEARAQGWIQ